MFTCKENVKISNNGHYLHAYKRCFIFIWQCSMYIYFCVCEKRGIGIALSRTSCGISFPSPTEGSSPGRIPLIYGTAKVPSHDQKIMKAMKNFHGYTFRSSNFCRHGSFLLRSMRSRSRARASIISNRCLPDLALLVACITARRGGALLLNRRQCCSISCRF